MKVFEFEFEFELYAVFHLAGRMDCMAQLNARCSSLHNVLCMVSVVLALLSVAQWALHGQCCLPLHAVYDERRVLFNVVLVHLIVVYIA